MKKSFELETFPLTNETKLPNNEISSKIKVEGYWYSQDEPYYPMPNPNVLSEKESQIIFNLIKEKEKIASKISYRGNSYSRITNEMLGSHEYRLGEWRWTGDLAQYYILEHKCKPTDEFLEFINYDNPNKDGSKGQYMIIDNEVTKIREKIAIDIAANLLNQQIDKEILDELRLLKPWNK